MMFSVALFPHNFYQCDPVGFASFLASCHLSGVIKSERKCQCMAVELREEPCDRFVSLDRTRLNENALYTRNSAASRGGDDGNSVWAKKSLDNSRETTAVVSASLWSLMPPRR